MSENSAEMPITETIPTQDPIEAKISQTEQAVKAENEKNQRIGRNRISFRSRRARWYFPWS